MKFKNSIVALLALGLATTLPVAAQEVATFKVIADKLDNARGLGIGPDGSIYVTEAGIGGSGACIPSPSVQGLPLCLGNTGAITRIKDGKQERIFANLPSLALQPSGIEAAGPQDIQFDAEGNAYLAYGFAGDPANRDALFKEPTFGRFYKIDLGTGQFTSLLDIAQYELDNDPDKCTAVDFLGCKITNPYAVAIKGREAYIVDAGGNSLYSVRLTDGKAEGFGLPTQFIDNPVFPPPDPNQPAPPGGAPPPGPKEVQSVPTGVAVGPDGAVYTSEFTGFPYPEGAARILRVGRDGKSEVFATGFTQLGDLEFDSKGNLYVLQIYNEASWKMTPGAMEGSLIKIAPNGKRTVLLSGNGLEAPTALAIAADDTIYITNKGASPGLGQVLKVKLDKVKRSESVKLKYESTISSPGFGPTNIFLPQGITVQPSTGQVWVSDGEGDRLQVFDERGNFVKTVGSSGTGLGQLNEPADLKFDNETGNLYVGDVFNNRINVYDGNGNPIKSFGSFGAPVEGRAFSGPGGLTFDKSGKLYVTDFSSDFIQVFNRNGDLINKIGSPGKELGQFQGPSGISVSPTTGKIYVGDQLNNRIQVLSPVGQPLFAFGETGSGPGQLLQPIGVEVDEFDNVYVADSINSRIQVFNKEGKFLTSFGKPVPNAGPQNILQPGQPLPEPGLFNWTAGAHYYRGKLYVGDFFNSRIQVLKVKNAASREREADKREEDGRE